MPVSVAVDLRSRFGPVRDQGDRPTCLAFAASDAPAGLRGAWDPLSCEYVFYHAQRRAGPPTKGAFLSDMLDALSDDGQPRENGWPYLKALPQNASDYRPPADVGPLYGRDGTRTRNKLPAICDALDRGEPSIVLTVLTRSFFVPPSNGVLDHIEGDAVFPTPRHAVVAVGYGRTTTEPAILIRNSWGPSWGLGGYGWITQAFLDRHMYDVALLTDETDVSCHSAAA